MKKLKLFVCILLFGVILGACSRKNELKPYIDFLEQQSTSPVDYVMGLFEKYDIVILGERHHQDLTQYQFINSLINDPRFINEVGHIFTEVGVHNQTERANKILKGQYDDYSAFERELIKLYRDVDYYPIWEKYNFWYLLSNIYKVNTGLDEAKKLTIHFTDLEFDWDNFIHLDTIMERYDRDSMMGVHFISDFDKIINDPKGSRKKVLAIFNTPHSYQNYEAEDYLLESAASYIFDHYPGKVANVMMHQVNWRKAKLGNYLFDNGKWDAVFRYIGNPDLGFDMEGSPFGEVPFNEYDTPREDIKFKDIYTGYIFYKPIPEWLFVCDIPGLVDEEYKPEYIRRIKLYVPEMNEEDLHEQIEYANKLTFENYFNPPKYPSRKEVDEMINQWLE